MDRRTHQTASDIVEAIDDEDWVWLQRVVATPAGLEAVMVLAQSSNGESRGYGAIAARLALGRGALGVLRALVDDSDADVRDIAWTQIELVDKRELRNLLPTLRRQLQAADGLEALSLAWRLAALGDNESAPAIEDLFNQEQRGGFRRRALGVVLLLLRSPNDVLARISSHDHANMRWLAYAASLLDSDEAYETLQMAASGLPDEECRAVCRRRLPSERRG